MSRGRGAIRQAGPRIVGTCRVCRGGVLASSKWPDCHPACHQWPATRKRYGPEGKGDTP
jgi:hypothetical protein